jgi:hypothetical protein
MLLLCIQVVQAFVYCVHLWLKFFFLLGKVKMEHWWETQENLEGERFGFKVSSFSLVEHSTLLLQRRC